MLGMTDGVGHDVARQQNKKSPKVLLAKFSFAIFAVLKVSMAWTGSISFYRSGLNLKGGKI